MYLRTPKRYRPGRPRRHLFNFRWLWLWIVTPIIVIGGLQLYERRGELQAPVEQALGSMIESVGGGIATAVAPTSTPRPDPSQALAAADGAWQSGAIEESLAAYRNVLPDIPNDVARHYAVALGLVMDGRAEDAVEAAERAVNANPFSPDAWAIRAYALTEAERPEDGIASALHALSLAPEHVPALAYLANAYFETNQIERAAQTVERGLEIDPESPEANFVNGLLNHYSRYDFPAAQRDYETALQYAPNRIDVRINLAWLEWALTEYDEALATLLEITELNPNNLDALYALSFLYYQAFGDPQQALEPINRCVDIAPTNRACLFYLGNVQRGLGNNSAALDAYRRLIETGTENPGHLLAAARAYVDGAGDCLSALSLLERGYQLEQESAAPNADRLTAYETLLQTCGSSILQATPTLDPEATPEATPP